MRLSRPKLQSLQLALSVVFSVMVGFTGDSLALAVDGVPGKTLKTISVTPTETVVPLPSPQELNPMPMPENTRLVLRLQERRVYLYYGETVATSYPVAVGRSGWETPTGTFQVMEMMPDPYWRHPWTGEVVPPGPDNPLGVRWIGFWTDGSNSIGFHGTPNEDLIGQAVSHGCVRMRNADVIALFEKVQVGVPVIVEP